MIMGTGTRDGLQSDKTNAHQRSTSGTLRKRKGHHSNNRRQQNRTGNNAVAKTR